MSDVLNKSEKPKNGGARPGAGRKAFVDKLTTVEKAQLYSITQAEYWVRVANDKAIKRLEEILDNPKENKEILMKAIKEVLDRALGKPKEHIDHTTKDEAITGITYIIPDANNSKT